MTPSFADTLAITHTRTNPPHHARSPSSKRWRRGALGGGRGKSTPSRTHGAVAESGYPRAPSGSRGRRGPHGHGGPDHRTTASGPVLLAPVLPAGAVARRLARRVQGRSGTRGRRTVQETGLGQEVGKLCPAVAAEQAGRLLQMRRHRPGAERRTRPPHTATSRTRSPQSLAMSSMSDVSMTTGRCCRRGGLGHSRVNGVLMTVRPCPHQQRRGRPASSSPTGITRRPDSRQLSLALFVRAWTASMTDLNMSDARAVPIRLRSTDGQEEVVRVVRLSEDLRVLG